MGNYNDFLKGAPTWIHNDGPQDWFFFDDFNDLSISTTAGAAKWKLDETAAGATQLLNQTLGGGVLTLTQAANDNDVISLFANSGILMNTDGQTNNVSLRFGAKWRVTDADDCDVSIGMGIYDASIEASEPADICYFRSRDGSAGLDVRAGKDSVYQSATGVVSAADVTWVRAFFEYTPANGNTDSGRLDYVIHSNGSRSPGSLTLVNTFPDDVVIFPFIQFQNGAASADAMDIDWIYAHLIRADRVDGTG